MTGALTRTALILILTALAGPMAAAEQSGRDLTAGLMHIAESAAAAGDFAKAADYARQAAKRDHGAAFALLAEFHETGKGAAKDSAQAAALYRKALELDFHPAGARLGWLYLTGAGVEGDADSARHWFRRTALLLPAMADRAGFLRDWMAARGVPDALTEALAWAGRVHGSSAGERYSLSLQYRDGKGVTQDKAMADHLLAGAYHQGVPAADFNNALNLLTSYPGRAKILLGVDLLHAAAVGGNTEAMRTLALRHMGGRDVAKSDVAAWFWLRRAKAAGGDVGREYHNLDRYLSDEDRKMAEWRLKANFTPEVW